MSFFSYFRLRIAQQVLCVSYSVPVAIFLTRGLRANGTKTYVKEIIHCLN